MRLFFLFIIIMISVTVRGSGGCGKSALCARFVSDTFSATYAPTVEDTYRKDVVINDGTQAVSLSIVDTAGQDEYASLADWTLQLTDVVIVVISCDSDNSVEGAERVLRHLSTFHEPGSLPVILARTKCDLPLAKWAISESTVSAFCARHSIQHVMHTSAKTNEGVFECFELAARLGLKHHTEMFSPNKSTERHRSVSITMHWAHDQFRKRGSLMSSRDAGASALGGNALASSTAGPFESISLDTAANDDDDVAAVARTKSLSPKSSHARHRQHPHDCTEDIQPIRSTESAPPMTRHKKNSSRRVRGGGCSVM